MGRSILPDPLGIVRGRRGLSKISLGAVSFLNARPLIAGLESDPRVALRCEVPSALPALLVAGAVDAALAPIIDVIRSGGAFRVVSDACIACDGETMTVRVFSQLPPDRLTRLCVDGDSHTSVALARVLWRELYGRDLEIRTIDAHREPLDELPAVLLIGDKVVDPRRGSFAYEVDLGGAWRQLTGLPFVFAVWAALNDECRMTNDECKTPGDESRVAVSERDGAALGLSALHELLCGARDTGVAIAGEIAEREGPKMGWPVELARRYLVHRLKFRLTERYVEGANLFARLCAQAGLAPAEAEIAWPEEPLAGTRRVPTGAAC